MLIIAIIIYATAMTVANLSIATFGPWVSPINAFFLIGLDLTLRDWLHMRLKFWQMGLLIAVSGALSYLLDQSAGMIAIASAVAFTSAAFVDWATFIKLRGTWLFRANGSNVAGAAIDSFIFPTLAFGIFMPQIILLQFLAKVCGGAFWSAVIVFVAKKRMVEYGVKE